MNILLIQACGTFTPKFIHSIFGIWSSLTLEQIASVTPNKHTVTMIKDLSDRRLRNLDYNQYDIVGISYYTATANIAYKLADEIRKYNVPVVLGGFHATALPDEAKTHADSVVIGEGEIVWPKLLKDFEYKGKMKPFYIQEKPIKSENIPCNTGKTTSILPVYSIEASRGCVNRCDFCVITNSPMGRTVRLRPVEKVLEQIEKIPKSNFIFMDSSLNINKNYTKKLFKGMAKMNKHFGCFFNANVTDDEELLKLAKDAGCVVCSVGFETVSQSNIEYIHKKTHDVSKYKYMTKKLHEYDMGVIASLAFGFDYDEKNVFDKTLEKLNEWGVDSIGVNILTPLPGTPLFKRLEKENRILTKDWSKYNYFNVVYQPKNMTPEELHSGTIKVIKHFFRSSNIFSRIISTASLGYYPFLGLLQHQITTKIGYSRATR